MAQSADSSIPKIHLFGTERLVEGCDALPPTCDGCPTTCDALPGSCDGYPATCDALPTGCDGVLQPATGFRLFAMTFRCFATGFRPVATRFRRLATTRSPVASWLHLGGILDRINRIFRIHTDAGSIRLIMLILSEKMVALVFRLCIIATASKSHREGQFKPQTKGIV